MRNSDFDRLNPKADEVSGLGFFNRGNLSKDDYTGKNDKKNLSFYLIFISTLVILFIVLFNSSYYLNNYGNSLKALAIVIIIILLISLGSAAFFNMILKKLK